MSARTHDDATDLINQVKGNIQVLVLRFAPLATSKRDLVALAVALTSWGGIIDRTPQALRVRCDFTVDPGGSIHKEASAVLEVIQAWASKRKLSLVLESLALHSKSDYDASILTPEVPPLAGISELAKHLKVTRQRASQLASQGRFGEPLARLDATPVWSVDTVDAVLAGTHGATKWRRTAGRPKSVSSDTASGTP